MTALVHSPVDVRVAAFRRSRLSAGLSEEDIQTLAAAMTTLGFAAGEVLIRQGEPGTRLHLITGGRVEVRVRTSAGAVSSLAKLGEGDIVGEMSLLTGDVTSAEVVALEPSETVALERSDFAALIKSHPQIVSEFVRILSRHLSATDAAVGEAREAERQLARFIQDERAAHYGELIGKHSSLAAVKTQAAKHAQATSPLLIHGEKGAGKEAIARLIHAQSSRRSGPMISAECTQINETPWGDKLFGASDGGANGARSVCYWDLAEGGTILLRDIEALPAALQDRLAQRLDGARDPGSLKPNSVRVIASSQRNLAELTAAKMITPTLARVLPDSLAVPPLRERKRDIPELALYFVKKYARRHNKSIEGLDDEAVRKLVSYDFRLGNVQELMETIDRAVILTDGSAIESQVIFLQPVSVGRVSGVNLLAGLGSRAPWVLRTVPRFLQGVVAVFFAGLLGLCFFGPAEASRNPATLLVWSVWWPALVLSFLLLGRIWCAVCPMAAAGSAAQKVKNFNLRVPEWIKQNDVLIAGVGFLLIIWVEEVTRMRHSPFATGLLLLAIGAGAIAGGILFPRRTWCRHLCPLGGVAGLCSTTAAVELRPTADVCAAKCKGHCCYKGNDHVAGCPMFNHVMFVNSNQHCVLCMNCTLTCPDRSPRLNLRVPGRELWFGAGASPQSATLVAMLMGVVAVLILLQHGENGWISHLSDGRRLGLITLALLAGAALPLAALHFGKRWLENPSQLWRAMLAFAPLVTAGLACFQLGFAPGLSSLYAGLEYRIPGVPDGYEVSFSVLGTIKVALLLFGLAGTAGALWKLSTQEADGAEKFGPLARTVGFGGATSYWGLLLVLLVGIPG